MLDNIESSEVEYRRIKSLSKFDLDYEELQEEFRFLVELAAMIADTEISAINLIDNYFQWTVTSQAIKSTQIPREESVCDRTIRSNKPLEIMELDQDEHLKYQGFSKEEAGFNYYLGIPLTLESGDNIGALCVLDKNSKEISDKNKAMLGLVAKEIVNKLELRRKMDESLFSLNTAVKIKNQVAHDVRGPINGITGLAELVESEDFSREEMLQYFQLIKDSGKSLLELTDDILKVGMSIDPAKTRLINLKQLKVKLLKLYRLLAKSKNIDLQIKLNPDKANFTLSKRKLLSIFGNLISNSIKFTPSGGSIQVNLDILNLDKGRFLEFVIIDTGLGISQEALSELRENKLVSSRGTSGEKGFGLGLKLVQEIIQDFNGELNIYSEKGQGTKIEVRLLLK
ncbi:GAF domain-containing sensor histidine kinase [Christiangramia sediminis]|uniref:histidine kinase n=1 Tax=Christiangramia sediminis TaxID=2881336 RepID=A0A9X1LJP1_9FLAO|nr:sensor histidine kinase [Christiangramia sediminis]MCB7481588.1 GAF domain-containing protein [Christiangramia sediminis]